MKPNIKLGMAAMPSRPGLTVWTSLRQYTLYLNSKVRL